MRRKRLYAFAILLTLLFSGFIYRIANIQLFSTEDFGPSHVNLLEESVSQRAHKLTLTDGRGAFIDRNQQSLTKNVMYDVVLFPFLKAIDTPVKEVASMTGIRQEKLTEWILNADKPFYLSEKTSDIRVNEALYQKIARLNFPGILPIMKTPTTDPMLGQHFLGLVRNRNNQPGPIGISGLEQAFNPFLVSEQSETLLYHVDAKGQPLFGLNVNYQGEEDMFYPVKIKTTLDFDLQKVAEEIVDRKGLQKGGLVLLDIHSRDVLAMVSRPQIDLAEPYKNNAIVNQMLVAQFPGSVFKTVVATAALEHRSINVHRLYNCDQNVYGDGESERELGLLTFEESFALSCNRTFAELAQEMVSQDPTILERYAEKLGVLNPVGWSDQVFHYDNLKHFPEEEKGTIWGEDFVHYIPRAVAQTAIGQKEVKLTPLSIANMMATIANNGLKKEVRGVQRILYQNGATMIAFKQLEHFENKISSYTALRLKQLLRGVVTEGTGSSLQGLNVAGKSGTAETGKDGYYHHWFAGFFPVDNPRYALVVVDLEQTDNRATTYPVFKNFVESIYRIEKATTN